MYKLGYGLIFWFSTTIFIGQSDTDGYSFELETGLSGQFFLQKGKKNIPFTTGPSSSTNTSVGLGLPIIFSVSKNYWKFEITSTFRFPITKEWLVQRNGVSFEDERSFIVDLRMSVIKPHYS